MLHIYMLRCSSFIQDKLNTIDTAREKLHQLLKGTIVKLHYQKQPQESFFEKIVH